MFKKIETMFYVSIVVSIVFAILGIVMIANPATSLTVICTCVSITVIAQGLIWIINHFLKSEEDKMDTFVIGIVSTVIGLILITHPKYLEVITGLFLGIWIVIESSVDMNVSLKLRKTDAPWVLTLCLSIITFIAGIVLVCNPQESAKAVMIVSGVSLLIESISSIVTKIVFKKHIKAIKSIFAK